MRYILVIGMLMLVFSCDDANAPDCLQTNGSTIQKEIDVAAFTSILVNPNIEVVIKQTDEYTVKVETGENLINEISAVVDDNRLILSNTNDCAYFRDNSRTKIYITAPNVIEIRSNTQFDIASDGVLNYDSLDLISEDFLEASENTTGTFHLAVNASKMVVVSNNLASFFIEGKTDDIRIVFASGIGRFEGPSLLAKRVTFMHRGSNKIIVNPQEYIGGDLRSTGDVLLVNKPSKIEVNQYFTGELLFL